MSMSQDRNKTHTNGEREMTNNVALAPPSKNATLPQQTPVESGKLASGLRCDTRFIVIGPESLCVYERSAEPKRGEDVNKAIRWH